jgi:hypothetical protein
MLKWHINRTGVIAISSAVGVIVGSMFIPALADVINPTPQPLASESAAPSESPTASDGSAPTPTPSDEATPAPTQAPLSSNTVLDGLVAIQQAQVLVQLADAFNKLCLDEGDYVHAQEQVDYYTATGELSIAKRYQALLDSHRRLETSVNEQVALLKRHLNGISRNSIMTLDLQNQVDQAQLDRAATEPILDTQIQAAQAGFDAAQRDGLTTEWWQQQIDALESAKQLFASSRQAF